MYLEILKQKIEVGLKNYFSMPPITKSDREKIMKRAEAIEGITNHYIAESYSTIPADIQKRISESLGKKIHSMYEGRFGNYFDAKYVYPKEDFSEGSVNDLFKENESLKGALSRYDALLLRIKDKAKGTQETIINSYITTEVGLLLTSVRKSIDEIFDPNKVLEFYVSIPEEIQKKDSEFQKLYFQEVKDRSNENVIRIKRENEINRILEGSGLQISNGDVRVDDTLIDDILTLPDSKERKEEHQPVIEETDVPASDVNASPPSTPLSDTNHPTNTATIIFTSFGLIAILCVGLYYVFFGRNKKYEKKI